MRAFRAVLCALLACALVAPAAAHAVPRGHLAESEYATLLAAYDRSATLGENATPADVRAVCALISPQTSRLLVAEHAACAGMARWMDAAMRFAKVDATCTGPDPACVAREVSRMERATRTFAGLVRADRRAVAARGLTGACRRAFGSNETAPALGRMASALAELRRAVLAGSESRARRAADRLDRAADGLSDAGEQVSLLRRCPRA